MSDRPNEPSKDDDQDELRRGARNNSRQPQDDMLGEIASQGSLPLLAQPRAEELSGVGGQQSLAGLLR